MIEQKIRWRRRGAGAAAALEQTIEDDRDFGHLCLNQERVIVSCSAISRCRHFVRRAVSRSRAAGCVRHAGPNCRSLRDPIASGWARPSSMTPDRASCRWRRLPTLRPIIALAQRFDEISRALVHALKYGDRLDLAPMMGRWISRAGRELLDEADALVPVPLHWRRLWARRFNQSARRGSIAANRRAGRCRRTQAGQADRAAGWAVADRMRRQCPRRVSCAPGTARPP